MYRVMVAGAGKIGSLIAGMLAASKDYQVHLVDVNFSQEDVQHLLQKHSDLIQVCLDVTDEAAVASYLKKHQISAVISSLPYYLNGHIATAACAANTHYFDLTEDISTTNQVKAIAKGATTAFVPQCGLAPGFVNIVASSLITALDTCRQAKLRVGALPLSTSHALQYALTWSTDGLINEYGNPCQALSQGALVMLPPLEGLEVIRIAGIEYEAFNTSGGLGSLAQTYAGVIDSLTYKTLRYPGHCHHMRFLMQDLGLNHDRGTLKRILENSLPKTYQDNVVIYVAVEGILQHVLLEKTYVNTLQPKTISGIQWSAIQVSTASSVCAVVDLVLSHPAIYRGLVLQEQFDLTAVLANRFGEYFRVA